MPYPIDRKLVVAVSSSALFDLSESNRIYEEEGVKAYYDFQKQNIDEVLPIGVAYPFVKRFLNINKKFLKQQPVEVVLLSRNSAATGRRVFRSIAHYGLDISRAAFLEGKSPHRFIPAFNASLFLSANREDVDKAIAAGYPAGVVLPSAVNDIEGDFELRIAFDFDGVIADDEAESVYKSGTLEDFYSHELGKRDIPHEPGPLADLFKKLAFLQKLESRELNHDSTYTRILDMAIVTARNAPAHERLITTLEHWGVRANQIFLLGGMRKYRVLRTLNPHIFFDDQLDHLESDKGDLPMVHIPFGVSNTINKT